MRLCVLWEEEDECYASCRTCSSYAQAADHRSNQIRIRKAGFRHLRFEYHRCRRLLPARIAFRAFARIGNGQITPLRANELLQNPC